MHPVAKRCLIWAAVLVVVGSITFVYGPDLLYRLGGGLSAQDRAGGQVLSFALNMAHNFALPLAAGLVTAAIVIQTLGPRPEPEPIDD
ncbi:hypothetical protein [Demequina sp. SO4-18]|uniref:hypothetical protein n=1 Tax=Demequina sp. SO4-18 TaxID=3401026 RepID=UPI003B5B2E86